jgi:hypothetical protein
MRIYSRILLQTCVNDLLLLAVQSVAQPVRFKKKANRLPPALLCGRRSEHGFAVGPVPGPAAEPVELAAPRTLDPLRPRLLLPVRRTVRLPILRTDH